MTKRKLAHIAISTLCLIALIVFVSRTGTLLHDKYSAEDLKLAEDTVRKYAVQCYALEGEYPRNLKYLSDNYTLTLNEDEYIYHYEYIGANMMPEISVIPID